MDAAGYTALTRQSGLMREMQVVANNIANLSTTGFRREGVIFAEHVARMDNGPSLSMARISMSPSGDFSSVIPDVGPAGQPVSAIRASTVARIRAVRARLSIGQSFFSFQFSVFGFRFSGGSFGIMRALGVRG